MSQTSTQKRTMTSAIPGLTVAQVRRALLEVRKKAQKHTPDDPFYITDKLSNGIQINHFCLDFVQGHSDKRHNKGKKDSDDETITPTTATTMTEMHS